MNSIKYISFVACLLIFISFSKAQYPELTPFYWNTISSVNPAFSGINSDRFINLQGFQNSENPYYSPYSIWAIGDVKSKKIHGALGLNYKHYRTDFSISNFFKLNYNYQIQFNDNHLLSFGISAAYHRLNLESSFYYHYDDIDTRQAFLPYYPIADNPPPSKQMSDVKAGGGLVYQYKKLQMGASISNYVEPEMDVVYGDTVILRTWKTNNVSVYNFYLNYKFNVFEHLEVNPFFAFNFIEGYENSPLMFNLNLILYEAVLLGGQLNFNSYSPSKLNFLLGLTVAKRAQINLAYGVYTSEFTNQIGNQYSIGLAYSIDK